MWPSYPSCNDARLSLEAETKSVNPRSQHPPGRKCLWVLAGCQHGGDFVDIHKSERLSLLTPCVLLTHFLLFLRCKVILDVEPTTDFLRGLASLDVVSNGFAGQIEE